MSVDPRPWYTRVYRWGQTNLTEVDPIRYDAAFWREQWRRTRIQGVIVNAGGIVAYYPSKFALHHRALELGDRDFYGEIVSAAREDGLAVLARMDSNRADARFYIEHPDWFTVDREGRPYRAEDLYIACVNSPYYDEFLADVLREIIERSHPDGITDNSWSGLERARICHCVNCARIFRDTTGRALPTQANWDDPAYREWITWSYARRVRNWELNNRITRDAGGPACLWIGMNSGDVVAQSTRFRDYKAICERTEIMMLDSQFRGTSGFQSNAEMGKLIHGLMGWDSLIPESTAMYQAGRPVFRVASKPEPEVRMWAVEGFAGTIQPWWHHIGAVHDDRRQYRSAESLFRWHEENQEFLVERRPVADVGVVWSQENVDFYGRDAAEERVTFPRLGVREALIGARIPSIPVHADHIARDADGLAVLILPNIGALSDAQCAAIRAFVERGGGVVATGETSRYDDRGDARPDFALAEIFGVEGPGVHHGSAGAAEPGWDSWAQHSYLRITNRHAVFDGFEDTDLLPFGGRLEVVRARPGVTVPLTFVPPFPIYPPEKSWMRQPTSALPALTLNETRGGGRVAYLAADLDRCFGRDYLPDHGRLLANLVRWTGRDRSRLHVDGAGLIDCHLYRQPGRLILHLVNLTNPGAWRPPLHELVHAGPFRVKVQLTEAVAGKAAKLLVTGKSATLSVDGGWAAFTVESILDHEVVVVS